ncbi:MAG: NAAT family transporter [Desulfobulbaceae bacterium]|nr:NAAT family transporter [Desulfobulbaceae bacterium]
MSILSAAAVLCLVMDPFGNAPFFLVVLKNVSVQRRQQVIIREMLIALAILLTFLITGPAILYNLSISQQSLQVAGGIVLFLIAIQMIFGHPETIFRSSGDEEPLIVPLAVPCVAGPSAIATVMLFTAQEPHRLFDWIIALIVAWSITGAILILSSQLDKLLGKRGLNALQSLMGLILTALAVEMFLQGIKSFFSR